MLLTMRTAGMVSVAMAMGVIMLSVRVVMRMVGRMHKLILLYYKI